MSALESTADKVARRQFVLPEQAQTWHVTFSPQRMVLCDDTPATLDVAASPNTHTEYVKFIVDVYLADVVSHPQGHVGWWEFDLPPGSGANLKFVRDKASLSVTSAAGSATEFWIADHIESPPEDRNLVVNLVLRHKANNAIISEQKLVAFADEAEMKSAAAIAEAYAGPAKLASGTAGRPTRRFNWPNRRKVHLVAQHLPSPGMAAHAFGAPAAARTLRQAGIDARLYATRFDPLLQGDVRHTRELNDVIAPDDVVILFYGDHEPNLKWLSDLPVAKAIVDLGISDDPKLQAFDAELFQRRLAAVEARSNVKRFDVMYATTRDTKPAGTARRIGHLTTRKAFWSEVAAEDVDMPEGKVLLCPAPLTPDHNFEAALQLFSNVLAAAPDAHLVVATAEALPAYSTYINHLLATTFAGIKDRVHLWTRASDARLKGAMQACAAMIYAGDMSPRFGCWCEDAAIFEKLLFVDATRLHKQADETDVTFRLYGTQADQAGALADLINHQENIPAPIADRIQEHELIWPLLEDLMQVRLKGDKPAKTS